jgi:ribosome small subunit-dependent GTPase A
VLPDSPVARSGPAHDQPSSVGNAAVPYSSLADLGWRPHLEQAWQARQDDRLVPGRVARVDRIAVTVLTLGAARRATVAAHLLHDPDPLSSPTVGDWVLLADDEVVEVLDRQSAIIRATAASDSVPQVLAANVDKVFIVCSLVDQFRSRRLERLLVLAWQSGAAPVVVLTKSDVAEDADDARREVERLVGDVEVLVVSAITGEGLAALVAQLEPGNTVALLGSSGAGKSTLINWLGQGAVDLATGEVRVDGRGRHTTTARELVRLPGGALLIDTPGLRSLALWDAEASIGDAFAEIEVLAGECRFSNCAHHGEPGCAIAAAVADGRLEADRLAGYERLRREQRELEARVDPRVRAEERAKWKALQRQGRRAQRPRNGR